MSFIPDHPRTWLIEAVDNDFHRTHTLFELFHDLKLKNIEEDVEVPASLQNMSLNEDKHQTNGVLTNGHAKENGVLTNGDHKHETNGIAASQSNGITV